MGVALGAPNWNSSHFGNSTRVADLFGIWKKVLEGADVSQADPVEWIVTVKNFIFLIKEIKN